MFGISFFEIVNYSIPCSIYSPKFKETRALEKEIKKKFFIDNNLENVIIDLISKFKNLKIENSRAIRLSKLINLKKRDSFIKINLNILFMHESQKYVENIQPYFNSKLDDDQRLLDTINRFLEFHNFEKIKDKNKILDIGSGKGTFVEVCKKRDYCTWDRWCKE